MTSTRPRTPPCRGFARHWFAYYGYPGSSSPTCLRRCGTANPRYRPEADIGDVPEWVLRALPNPDKEATRAPR